MNNLPPFHPHLDAARMSIMQGLGELAAYLGFNRTLGHVYGALLLCDGPLSLDELAQRVSRSKASVCQQTQILANLSMVRRVDGPSTDSGTRRAYYEVKPNLELAAQMMVWHKFNQLDRIDASISANVKTLQRLRAADPAPEDTLDRLTSRVDTLYSLLHVVTGILAGVAEAIPETVAGMTEEDRT